MTRTGTGWRAGYGITAVLLGMSFVSEPLLSSVLAGTARAGGFRLAQPGYHFSFPADHGAHEDFRTEWWYYTGHLTAANGHRLGYQVTFFRRGMEHKAARTNPSAWTIRNLYLAHLAVSDIDRQRFRYAEKLSRAGLGKAGAATGRLSVWIDRWTVEMLPGSDRQRLTAQGADFSIELTLSPQKPLVIHGEQGISRKGDSAKDTSHYYSMTRMATEGVVTLDGEPLTVNGLTWMDHEFGSGDLADELVGWDWFSMQLEDGREIMLYLLRRRDGMPHPASSGTVISQSGRSEFLRLVDVSVRVLEHWTSSHSGARYPSRWRITVPRLGLDLELSPRLADQELRTARSTQVTYWEGAVGIVALNRGHSPAGQGYVELTGYARPIQLSR